MPDAPNDPTDTTASAPIFLRGIMQRSGTNFVHDVLCLHPDVAPRSLLPEDHLFGQLDLIVNYADRTVAAFRPEWPIDRFKARADLLRHLGDGLSRFVSVDPTSPWFVSKMPSMDGVDQAAEVFPRAPLVVVVRDGRAVVESAVKTFKVPFDREVARWADGARSVLRVQANYPRQVTVVRYEDLLADPVGSVTHLLRRVGLNPDVFPFDSLSDLPVRGSSELATRGEVHWAPVGRSEIHPEQRGTGLSAEERALFDRLAGAESDALGYLSASDLKPGAKVTLRTAVPSSARVRWSIRRSAGRIRRQLRSFL